MTALCGLFREVAQHIMKDTAIAVVIELIVGIDAHRRFCGQRRTIGFLDLNVHLLPRLNLIDPFNRDFFIAFETKTLPSRSTRRLSMICR